MSKPIIVELHPNANSGESATAEVNFTKRSMSLILESQSYGRHTSKFSVYFDNPNEMEALAAALKEKAVEAKEFFKNNP